MCTKSGGGGSSGRMGSLGIPNSRGQWGGNWRPFVAAFFHGRTAWSPFRPSSHPADCRWRRFCEAVRLA